MNCIEIDEILSTTVLYEGFFNYNEFFKISKDSIHKILSIVNKHKNYCSDSDLDKKEVYFHESLFTNLMTIFQLIK